MLTLEPESTLSTLFCCCFEGSRCSKKSLGDGGFDFLADVETGVKAELVCDFDTR